MSLLNFWISLISGIFGIGVPLGIFVNWLVRRRQDRRQRQTRLRLLTQAATRGEIAVCIGIGGKGGKPETDVLAYLRKSHKEIGTVLVYQAPDNGVLAEPATAMQIMEDIRAWVREFGEEKIARVHFFPAGILAYPFVVGAMLSNICRVIVYQKELTGQYVALYEWNSEFSHGSKRATKPLTHWRAVPVNPESAPTPRREAMPQALPPVSPNPQGQAQSTGHN